jgi:hypothetical protein
MDWLSPLLNALKSLVVNFGAFLAGKYAEKYERNKDDLETEKERDKIDADPPSSPDALLKRMRDEGF